MRTTVDLPDATHFRVKEAAARQGISMSSMLAQLTALGLERMDCEPATEVDQETGLSLLRVGRPISTQEVDDFLAESE